MQSLEHPGELALFGLPRQIAQIPVRKYGQDVELQASLLGGEVELILGESHDHAHALQLLEVGQDLVQVAGEAIQVMGDDGVHLALVHLAQHGLEAGAFVALARVLIPEHAHQGPVGFLLGQELPTLSLLSLQGVALRLLFAGDP